MIPVENVHEFVVGIGYDALIEFILMLICGLVCVTALRVYQITKGRRSKMLSLGFLLLTIAYGSIAVGNLTLYLQGTLVVKELFFFIIHFAYLFAKTLGLLTLACIPLRVTDWRVYGLLAFLTCASIYASTYQLIIYQVLCLVLYAIIITSFTKSYIARKNRNTLLLALGFGFLAISAVSYFVMSRGYTSYISGHILEFIGYAFILSALLFAYTFHETRKTSNNS
jgi:hypothetical protein